MQLIWIGSVKMTNLTHGMYDRLYLETKHTAVTNWEEFLMEMIS